MRRNRTVPRSSRRTTATPSAFELRPERAFAGRVEHITSGQVAHVTSLRELPGFLAEVLHATGRRRSPGGALVLSAGFDFANNIPEPYVALLSFADGTSQNFMLHASAFQFLSPLPDFFGLTSSVEITRIHIGLIDGGATSDNLFAIDNLSVAAPESAPPAATPTAICATTATNMPTATATRLPAATSTVTTARTATPALTSTPSATGSPMDEAALAAAVGVATEPLFRLFDVQASVGTPGSIAGRSSVAGCQQLDCVAAGHVTGTEEDCCVGTRSPSVVGPCGARTAVQQVSGGPVVFSLRRRLHRQHDALLARRHRRHLRGRSLLTRYANHLFGRERR